jgi:uncharacterized protein
MRISISGLSEGPHAYHFTVDPSAIGLGESFKREVTADVLLEKTGRELYLRGEARIMGHFVCDRCADEFDREIVASFRIVYIFDEQDKGRFPGEEVQVITAGTHSLDISEDTRQFLMLSIPLKLLCRENCQGLCPVCGTNWNVAECSCGTNFIDPRWQTLKKNFPN